MLVSKKQPTQEDRKEETLGSEEVDRMRKKIKELSEKKKTFPAFPPEVSSDVSE